MKRNHKFIFLTTLGLLALTACGSQGGRSSTSSAGGDSSSTPSEEGKVPSDSLYVKKVENAVIDPAGFSGGMSFKEYLNKVAHETEAHFFKRWFDILTGKSNELADIISDSDYRVTQNPVHDGIKLFTREEVKDFFRKAKYKDK